MRFFRRVDPTQAAKQAARETAEEVTAKKIPVEEAAKATAKSDEKGNFNPWIAAAAVGGLGVAAGAIGLGAHLVGRALQDGELADRTQDDMMAAIPMSIERAAQDNPNIQTDITSAAFANYIEKQQQKEDEYARKLQLARMQREAMESNYGGQY